MPKWTFGTTLRDPENTTVMVIGKNNRPEFVADDGYSVEIGDYIGITLSEEMSGAEAFPVGGTCWVPTDWGWDVIE